MSKFEGDQRISATPLEGHWTKTTCAYCGVGCGIEARVNQHAKLEVRGDETHPANYGRLCSKGLALGETTVADGRLLTPTVLGEQRSWPQALDTVAQRITAAVEEHGPDSVAFYVSGQFLTEDYYVANKLMKGFIGSGNIDTNSRLCMSSSVAGHVRAFGSDTVPGCYEDLELADLVVLVGSNLAWCHPVLYQRLRAAKEQRPQMRVVVVDPRRTDTCDLADLHLALNPGTDVALFNGLLSFLARSDAVDSAYVEQHTENFLPALVAAMEDGANVQLLANKLGLYPQDLETFFRWFADTENTVTVYSQGVNQSSRGTDKVNGIINCHLATGRIGKPGCGPFSVTGQPNAMGGREVGGLANMLAAHMDFSSEENLRRVADFWQTDRIAKQPGMKAVDLFDAVADGRIKVLWIMATNPLVSMPNANKIKKALELCPTVIVSDCIADTETTRCADILLPAAGWAEKSGTVTNSERRISRQRALLPLNGEARPDWWIMTEVAKRMGFGDAFNYHSEYDVFVEYAALTGLDNHGSRDLDISALADLNQRQYEELKPVQWPLPKSGPAASAVNKRLFGDGRYFTKSGKAQFVALAWRPPVEQATDERPLILNSGRIRDQWHTMTRTGLATRLNTHLPEPFVSVHPQDARRFDLTDNGLAEISSAYGEARLRVRITTDVRPGHLFMPLHWTSVQSGAATVGRLAPPHVDPVSGQPELKHTPVSIKPWHYGSEALIVISSDFGDRLPDLETCAYWARQRINGGHAYYVASAQTPGELQASLNTISPSGIEFELLNFSNPSRGEHRIAVGNTSGLIYASIVASSLLEQDLQWLTTLLGERLDSDTRRAIIKGQAPGSLATGQIVCACKQVGRNTICNAIRNGCTDPIQVGEATGAGTGCGSCVAEIKTILASETMFASAV